MNNKKKGKDTCTHSGTELLLWIVVVCIERSSPQISGKQYLSKGVECSYFQITSSEESSPKQFSFIYLFFAKML